MSLIYNSYREFKFRIQILIKILRMLVAYALN